MNKEVIEGHLRQWKGKVQESLGFLLMDGFEVARGRREQFEGRIITRKGLREDDRRRRSQG